MKKPLLLAAGLLCCGFACCAQPKSGLRPPPTVDLAEAQKRGQQVVADLLAQKPAENSTNRATIIIRHADSKPETIPVRFEIGADHNGWITSYETVPGAGAQTKLTVAHAPGQPNQYLLQGPAPTGATGATPKQISGNETMIPFAGSDFWVADLGLEFLHWPKQLLLRKEMKRGRSCDVLESINPQPIPGAYSRVVSWLDEETGGIVHADAFDVHDQLLKQFDPKEFKKIQGQWQLEGMEIRNRETGSRTRIEFNLTTGRTSQPK